MVCHRRQTHIMVRVFKKAQFASCGASIVYHQYKDRRLSTHTHMYRRLPSNVEFNLNTQYLTITKFRRRDHQPVAIIWHWFLSAMYLISVYMKTTTVLCAKQHLSSPHGNSRSYFNKKTHTYLCLFVCVCVWFRYSMTVALLFNK